MQLYDDQRRRISLDSLGLIPLKLHVSPPSFTRETEYVPGVGEITIERTLNPRQLEAELWMKSMDLLASKQDLSRLHYALGQYPHLYVSDAPGKLWEVVLDEWDTERINTHYQSITLPLVAPTGRAESINEVERVYTGSRITFENQGNSVIDTRTQNDTEIEFVGASTGLTIANETIGDMWTYEGSTTAADTILLKGVQSLKNGKSIFRDTNKKLLTFAPGANQLTISGATDFTLSVRTRFYFL